LKIYVTGRGPGGGGSENEKWQKNFTYLRTVSYSRVSVYFSSKNSVNIMNFTDITTVTHLIKVDDVKIIYNIILKYSSNRL